MAIAGSTWTHVRDNLTHQCLNLTPLIDTKVMNGLLIGGGIIVAIFTSW